MKKMILVLFLLVTIPVTAMAGGDDYLCDTQYPVILAHGMGASAEILGFMDYWGPIDNALSDEGCAVYKTSVNGMDSTANKAANFKTQVLQILAVTGASKVNIIGHSHGTVYSRYAISNLGLASKVASHTSIAGPHRGSAVADAIIGAIPDSLEGLTGDSIDFIYSYIFGDTDPNSLDNAYDMSRPYMINTFNPNTPNMGGIYYQSWAAKIKMMAVNARNWYFIGTWPLLLGYEGANDGLVSITSAQWGNFRGVEDASWYSAGCDHLNIVGMPLGLTTGFDEEEFYIDMVAELKGWGY